MDLCELLFLISTCLLIVETNEHIYDYIDRHPTIPPNGYTMAIYLVKKDNLPFYIVSLCHLNYTVWSNTYGCVWTSAVTTLTNSYFKSFEIYHFFIRW